MSICVMSVRSICMLEILFLLFKMIFFKIVVGYSNEMEKCSCSYLCCVKGVNVIFCFDFKVDLLYCFFIICVGCMCFKI